MKTIHDIYRYRLRLLIAEHGSQTALANALDKPAAQISQWISTGPSSRQLSPFTARQIEKALGKPLGWMDQPLNEGERRAAESFVPPIGRPVRQPAGGATMKGGRSVLSADRVNRLTRFYRLHDFIEAIEKVGLKAFKHVIKRARKEGIDVFRVSVRLEFANGVHEVVELFRSDALDEVGQQAANGAVGVLERGVHLKPSCGQLRDVRVFSVANHDASFEVKSHEGNKRSES